MTNLKQPEPSVEPDTTAEALDRARHEIDLLMADGLPRRVGNALRFWVGLQGEVTLAKAAEEHSLDGIQYEALVQAARDLAEASSQEAV